MLERSRLGKAVDYVFLLLFSAYALAPVLWLLITSVKTNEELVKNGPLAWPEEVMLQNYVEAWETARFSTYFLNSVFITTLTVAAIVVCSVLISYTLCYLSYPGKGIINGIILFGLLIPFELIMIPLFQNVQKLQLINTHWAVILPQIALWLPFSAFLVRCFMRDLPIALLESARLDGAGEYRCLFSIVVPMIKPSIVSIIIFNLISSWNNFMLPSIMIMNDKLRTVPLGLNAFKTKYSMDVALTSAAAMIIALPMIVVYLIFQRKLISGLVVGAVKQ